jgi:hypothetical protein
LVPSAFITFRTISPAPKVFRLLHPLHHVDARIDAPAVDEDPPLLAAIDRHAIRIQTEDCRAAAELSRDLASKSGFFTAAELRLTFLRARLDESRRVVERPDATAHGQRHEDLFDHVRDEVGHDLATFVRRRDVVEDQFIRTISLIALRLFDGIAGVDVVKELHTLTTRPRSTSRQGMIRRVSMSSHPTI